MSDLVTPTEEQLNEIKEFFLHKYGVLLSDLESREVYLSLFHLGRAIYRFSLVKEGLLIAL